MQIASFEFAAGARFQKGANANANEIGQHLEILRQRSKSELTPLDVLNDARNPNSPLHSYFEWDDGAAAEQHRLWQARSLIRAVVAVYVQDDKPPVRTRAYVHVPDSESPHYREMSHAMSVTHTRELVLRRAWSELSQWRERYRHMQEFADLVSVIDDAAPGAKAAAI